MQMLNYQKIRSKISRRSSILLAILIGSMFFQSCYYYGFSDQKVLVCSHKITQGFHVAKITNVECAKDGVPIQYTFDTIVHCGTVGDVLSESEMIEFKEKGFPVLETGKKFKAKRKIYFLKENISYNWFYTKPSNIDSIFPIFPLSFRPGSNYLIYKLLYKGNPGYAIFIKVDEKGKFNTVHFTTRGIFPSNPYQKIK